MLDRIVEVFCEVDDFCQAFLVRCEMSSGRSYPLDGEESGEPAAFLW